MRTDKKVHQANQGTSPEAPVSQGGSRTDKLMKLEAIRGLSAIYVVFHHTIQFEYYFFGLNLGRLLRFGQEAVILFFLVSGFVIHLSHQSTLDKSFKTYFVKRFARIYVPLLVVFCVGFLLESYQRGVLVEVPLIDLLGNLLMLQDWPSDKPGVLVDPLLGNDPLWSLAYEWWFYMLYFPLVSMVSDRQRLSLIVFGVAIASSVIYCVWPSFIPRVLMYAGIWWSGVFLAELYLNHRRFTLKTCFLPLASLSGICGVLLINGVFWWQAGGETFVGKHPIIELRHTGFALVALACAILWHRCKWVGFNVIVGPFAVLAPISYVIYISHYHLMVTATWFSGIGNGVVAWFLYFVGLLVFSWAVELRFYPMVRRQLYARFL
ncbi:MAG: acyltransferase family protein [Granulosicoccus sp.]